MKAATRRMRLDAIDNVRKAKAEFRKKIADLGKVVAENDKKADKKILDLTGVVRANAAKSAKGRKELAALEEANKQELKGAIRQMIDRGEKRAQLVEDKLTAEIGKLRAETDKSVGDLAALTAEARA